MDETSAEKRLRQGEDIYCIRSDGDGWMYVRAKTERKGFTSDANVRKAAVLTKVHKICSTHL